MPNIPELEQRLKRYQYKKFIPYTLSLVGIVILIIVVVVISNHHSDTSKPIQKHISQIKKIIATTVSTKKLKKIKNQNTIIKQTIAKNIQTLKPQLKFMNTIGDSIIPSYKNSDTKQQKHVHHQIIKHITKKSNKTIYKHQLKKNRIITHQPSGIIITTKPIGQNMKDIIKRFKQSNSPILGLFLAKKYYQMKRYNLSYNYSLATNQLSPNNDESWIIFIKSLVKLGQKKMAIRTLKSYISHSKSKDAQALLNNIESGRFK